MPRRSGTALKKMKKNRAAGGAAAGDRGVGAEANEVTPPAVAATEDMVHAMPSESADHGPPMIAVSVGPPLPRANTSVDSPKVEDPPVNGETAPATGSEFAPQDRNVSLYLPGTSE